ncbi:hypothetical protein Tco_0476527, partial [Tanacetum coccineum]
MNDHGTNSMTSCDSIGTPMATKHLDADLSGTPVDQTKYRSMVGALKDFANLDGVLWHLIPLRNFSLTLTNVTT